MKNHIILILLSVSFVACNVSENDTHTHEEEGHAHDNEWSVDTTIWTNGVELFVEYPAFVVGHPSRFAAHFTLLDGHQPVKKGSVTVSLIKGNKGIRHKVDAPSSPGIFTPSLEPKKAGEYQLMFELTTPELTTNINAGTVQVYPDDKAVEKAFSGKIDSEPEISFLKEQAWKIDFQTIPTKIDTVYEIEKATGKWVTSPGTEQNLNAGASGNVLYEMPEIVEGLKVRKRQILMRISSDELNMGSLASEIKKAKAEYEQANSVFKRKQELYELDVVPEAEFEEVKKRFEVAQANYQQLLKNYGAKGVTVRAPFDGFVKSVLIENGAFVNAGDALLKIGEDRSHLIKAFVIPEKYDLIHSANKIWIDKNGALLSGETEIVSIGKTVSDENPMLPVFVSVHTSQSIIEGSLVEVQFGKRQKELGISIPKSALLEEYGTYKVIVQTGGEAFEMRPVKIGAMNGDQVFVTKGLETGEWVVTKGTYQVKMAAMSGAPAHGHAH